MMIIGSREPRSKNANSILKKFQNSAGTKSLKLRCKVESKKLPQNNKHCKQIKKKIESLKRKEELEKNTNKKKIPDSFNQEKKPKNDSQIVNSNLPMPITGDQSTYNLNRLLRENILLSQYFKDLLSVQYLEEMISEIKEKVKHAEPWAHAASAVPSTLFCCLYRMMMMKLSLDDIKMLMDYRGNPYVRCSGMLYLRYCGKPELLWNMMSGYLGDQTEFKASLTPNSSVNLGGYVEDLLTELSYYGTYLPRIPVMIEREIKKKVMIFKERKTRKQENLNNIHNLSPGTTVQVYDYKTQNFRKGVIEMIDGEMVRVNYAKAKDFNVEAGLMQLEMLEKQIEEGGGEFLVQEDMVKLEDIKLIEEEEKVKETQNVEEARKSVSKKSSVSLRRNKRRERSRDRRKKRKRRRRKSSTPKRRKRRDNRRRRDNRDRKRRKRRRKRSISSTSSSSDSSSDDSSSSSSSSPEKSRNKHISKRKGGDKYLEAIKRQEKMKATANSKKEYAQKARSFKASLTQPIAKRRKQDLSAMYGGPSAPQKKKEEKVYSDKLLEGMEHHRFG